MRALTSEGIGRPGDAVTGMEIPGYRGELIGAGHAGYDDARAVWNGMVDRRPRLIARCTGVADVASAVRFARDRDLEIAVRGGGHNVAGTAVCDDGIVIDLSAMRAVSVDPTGRTAHVQGGALWGDVDHETQAHGLATTGGIVGHTGVGGLCLGGGLGWLMRKHGLTVDNLVEAEVVTAEGDIVRARPTSLGRSSGSARSRRCRPSATSSTSDRRSRWAAATPGRWRTVNVAFVRSAGSAPRSWT
jgi:hypothetical protein